MKILKRVVALVTCGMMLFSMASCGKQEIQSFVTPVSDDIMSRFNNTKLTAQSLHDSGIISDTTYNKIKSNIDDLNAAWQYIIDYGNNDSHIATKDEIVSLLMSPGGHSNMNIAEATVALMPVGNEDDITNTHGDVDNLAGIGGKSIADFMACQVYGLNESQVKGNAGTWMYKTNLQTVDGTTGVNRVDKPINGTSYGGIGNTISKTAQPIDIVPDSAVTEIRNSLNYTIKVLKPDANGTNTSFEALQNTINKSISNGKVVSTDIDKLFYDSGVTLGDLLDGVDLTKIVTVSKTPGENGSDKANMVNTTLPDGRTVKVASNEEGQDLIICQSFSGGDVPSLMVKVQEFDTNVANAFQSVFTSFKDGQNGRFIVSNNSVYLLEYPVEAIDRFVGEDVGKVNDVSKFDIKTTFKDAGLALNIVTGAIFKYDVAGNGFGSTGTYISESGSSYLKTTGENASFAVIGCTQTKEVQAKVTSKGGSGKNKTAVKSGMLVPRIVLIDYLEATYAPSFNTGEKSNLVVFGRKVRFLTDSIVNTGSKSYVSGGKTINVNDRTLLYRNYESGSATITGGKECAIYVGINGQKDTSAATGNEASGDKAIRITDIVDIGKLIQSKTVANFPLSGEDPFFKKAETDTESKLPDMTELAHTTKVTSINATRPFPSDGIGNADWSNDKSGSNGRPRFWCVALKTGIFNSNLYNAWITSTDPAYSMSWWNKYLANNNFEYYIDEKEIKNYLLDNYTKQLANASGLGLIDTTTISRIQDVIDKEEMLKSNRLIRTVYIVVGWALICLAILLLLIWAVDTNADLGLNLLSRVTFGNWIAVKYESDIPAGQANSNTYVTGKNVFIKSIILIFVGYLLISVDVFYLVNTLVDMFGGIARWVSQLIKGD